MENTFEVSELAKYGLLDNAIKYRIMSDLIKNNIKLKEEIALKLKEQFYKKIGFKNNDERDLWLKKRNLTIEELDDITQLKFKWKIFCKNKFKSSLRSIFLKKKDEFDTVIYSLLRVNNQNLIRELYQQIYEKEFTFLEIASQYSDGPEKRTGGLIGPVAMSNPHPFLKELLRVSLPGQLSPPIKFDKWWILIRLEELNSAKFDENIKEKLALIEGEKFLRKKLNNNFK